MFQFAGLLASRYAALDANASGDETGVVDGTFCAEPMDNTSFHCTCSAGVMSNHFFGANCVHISCCWALKMFQLAGLAVVDAAV